jgi:hypothetical protein
MRKGKGEEPVIGLELSFCLNYMERGRGRKKIFKIKK